MMETQQPGGLVNVAYSTSVRVFMGWLEANLVPDYIIRKLTRTFLARRLRLGYKLNAHLQLADLMAFVKALKQMPIALNSEVAKAQHYELPTSFFQLVLGKHLKYSSAYFTSSTSTLNEAEEAMLELYCERAKVKDGQTILDIGCGWGSLTLYIARKYPNNHVTGICNSTTQKVFIEDQCRLAKKISKGAQRIKLGRTQPLDSRLVKKISEGAQHIKLGRTQPLDSCELGLCNVIIFADDISKFETENTFDRIISIEMFEHMKNYGSLLKKISQWMKPESLLFVHHFCHKVFAFHFEDVHEDDWITRYFFSGGTMPSSNLLLYFQDHVAVVDHWLVNGKHYAQTSEEWLKNMDNNLNSIVHIFNDTYGGSSAKKWMAYWRTFFIAVVELFGYNDGEEWMVSHLLFKKK